MYKKLRRLAVISLAITAGTVISQAAPASAAPRVTVRTGDYLTTGDVVVNPDIDIVSRGYSYLGRGLGDAAQGLGGGGLGPLPAPTPGIRPDAIVEWAKSRGGNVSQGLGGGGLGPIPAPTPGIRPVQVLTYIIGQFSPAPVVEIGGGYDSVSRASY
ncbi:MAG TPA: hypothetical protein VM030_09945 [Acidimicrobiales bacterium]|nr:hypothetical protein [Acidimicrobiales bacterium]